MPSWIIQALIFGGSFLMVYNIYGFVRYARFVKGRKTMGKEERILHIPIFLLVMFLLGYVAVGVFGKPDIIMAGILFGGSVFVFIIYHLLNGITRRIIEAEHLEAELKAAEENSRAKTSFLATISHEMRTPMNVILGLDALALKNPDLPQELSDQLQKIGQSGRHLLGLINNTLDLHDIETGQLTVHQAEFSLRETVDQIDAIAKTQCDEKGLAYASFIQDEAAGRYLGDALVLKQVMLGLLDNAVKYTDAPGRVSFAVEREMEIGSKRTLRFSVTDTGIGISKEFLPKAFDVFTQEDDTSTTRHRGSGLGLAVIKRKVRLLGGEVTAVSEKNVGTSVMVTLILPYAGPEAHVEAPAKPAAEAEIGLEGCRVLIVEDIPENAEIVADLLELEGVESERAENGQIAVEMFSASEPFYYDAVLMDLRMPIMDGLNATRGIRALQRQDAPVIPIIALTANAFETDVQQSLEAGMNAHMSKPVDADLLYATLKEWIRKARKRRGTL